MPIPKPHDDEEENDFISRCMGNDTMQEDYSDNDQRLAICYTQWENREGKAMGDLERKSIQVELKEDKEGSFIAKIATLNVIDKDGDETVPGAIEIGKEVLVSAYMHGSWMGGLPVGKAVLSESKDALLADGEFNLNTETGREHYEAVKFSGKLQEWSYGFKVDESEEETRDGQKIRVLKKVTIFEISPVLLGAGMETATLAIKEAGKTFSDEGEAVLAAVESFIARTKSLADLRQKEGRVLSSANRDRMKKLLGMLSGVASDLKELLDATEPVDTEKLAQAVLIFTKIKRELSEVT